MSRYKVVVTQVISVKASDPRGALAKAHGRISGVPVSVTCIETNEEIAVLAECDGCGELLIEGDDFTIGEDCNLCDSCTKSINHQPY